MGTIFSILRAGNGLLDGILELIPAARVGFLGLYRDPDTLQPVQYYAKVPNDLDARMIIVVDPMLATGGTLIEAIRFLYQRGAARVTCLCLLGAPEGIERLEASLGDVEVDLYLAAVDERLDERSYIVPGLGDAGDRLYGLAE